jgi:citrate synthase
MTVTQHADKEIALKAEIEELIRQLRDSEYRTKREKEAISADLQAKRVELREHIAIPLSDLDRG